MVLTSLFVTWAIRDWSTTSAYMPEGRESDFRLTDLYALVGNASTERHLDTEVVVVGLDNLSRDEIADALELIGAADPRAVGLDVIFSHPEANDSRLVEVLRELGTKLVAPTTSTISSYPVYDSIPGLVTGSVELPVATNRATVRDYYAKGSFPARLAETFTGSQTRQGSGADVVPIYWGATEFRTLDPSELEDNLDLLEGKAVIAGMLGDYPDMHPTPVDDNMPGTLIHAHALSNILSGNHLTVPPKWVEYLVGIVMGWSVIFFYLWASRTPLGNFMMRTLQILLLALIVASGMWMYFRYNICFDFAWPLMLVGVSIIAGDVWSVVPVTARWLASRSVFIKTKQLLKNKLHKTQTP